MAAAAARRYRDLKEHDYTILINATMNHLRLRRDERNHVRSPHADAVVAADMDGVGAAEVNVGTKREDEPIQAPHQEPGPSHPGDILHLSQRDVLC